MGALLGILFSESVMGSYRLLLLQHCKSANFISITFNFNDKTCKSKIKHYHYHSIVPIELSVFIKMLQRICKNMT